MPQAVAPAQASKEREETTNENKRTVTILIPCYNEEESLPMLFARLTTLSENAQLAPDDDDRIDYRFLFVDDGSKDSTRDEIREFASNRFDTGFIFLSRNFGKEHAMLAGIDAVDTDALVIIDADLQDPPELIGDMVKLWRQGYEDVYAHAARARAKAGSRRPPRTCITRCCRRFPACRSSATPAISDCLTANASPRCSTCASPSAIRRRCSAGSASRRSSSCTIATHAAPVRRNGTTGS